MTMRQTLAVSGIDKGKRRELRKIAEAAIDQAVEVAGLDDERVGQVIYRAHELKDHIADKVRELSLSDRFVDEEASSNLTYPSEYRGPKTIKKQIAILLKKENFPGLDPESALRYYSDVYRKLILPNWVEGAFVIPANHALAENYCDAANLVLTKIATSRNFHNYREGEITPEHFRLNYYTAQALTALAEQQPGDFWIIPSQFGLRHRGRSVRRVREVMTASEFGGYTVQVGAMILTHPERLVRWEQLHIDLPGDEFRTEVTDRFDRAPALGLPDSRRVRFAAGVVFRARARYGSVSAFLPPVSP